MKGLGLGFGSFFVSFGFGRTIPPIHPSQDMEPKKWTVDLDQDPKLRWSMLAQHYAPRYAKPVAELVDRYFPEADLGTKGRTSVPIMWNNFWDYWNGNIGFFGFFGDFVGIIGMELLGFLGIFGIIGNFIWSKMTKNANLEVRLVTKNVNLEVRCAGSNSSFSKKFGRTIGQQPPDYSPE